MNVSKLELIFKLKLVVEKIHAAYKFFGLGHFVDLGFASAPFFLE